MTILKFTEHVQTDMVGSRVEFEVDDEFLSDEPSERRVEIDAAAREAMFESGVFEWGYEEARGSKS